MRKNPRTKSYIWTTEVLTVGQEFCEKWARTSCVETTDADGNVISEPLIPSRDPDLKQYEDVSQILINNNVSSQGAKRKLIMGSSSEITTGERTEKLDQTVVEDNEADSHPDDIPVLNPEEVSKTLSQIQDENVEPAGPNCSAINGDQV